MKTIMTFIPVFEQLHSNVRSILTLKTYPIGIMYKYVVFIILMFFTSILFAQVAPVNPPTGGFDIDGNLLSDSKGDWVNGGGAGGYLLYNNAGTWEAVNSTTTKFRRDDYNNSADFSFTGGSSFGDNPNDWSWSTGKPTSKCDINTAIIHETTSATDKWLILAGDRLTTTGTSYIDFEFSQGVFTRENDGAFKSVDADGVSSLASTNGRKPGDFVLSMEYSNGGTNATVHYYVWEQVGSTYKYVEKPIPGGVSSAAFGATNGIATSVPFGAFGSTSYIPYAFVEAAVNIDAIFNANCLSVTVKTVFIKTKASDSYNAALKDFVDPIPVDFQFGNAGLEYGGPNYCKTGTLSPTVPASPAGTFSASPAELVWSNQSNGVIDLASTPAGTYTITYTPTGGVCLNPASDTVIVDAIPTALVLTGSSICSSDPGTGTISSGTSASGVSYQLYDVSNTPVQTAKSGTGSGLTWTGLTAGNGYYAVGTGSTPAACNSQSNAVNVTSVNNPTALVLTGSSICSSDPGTGTISSGTSASGVSYQLYDVSNTPVQTAKSGTGSGLTWTALTAGTGYYVIGTGGAPTSCTSTSNTADVATVNDPTALVLTGSSICSSDPGTGTISSGTSVSGVSYQLYDVSNTPVQSAKSGTGSGLTWTALTAGTGYYVIGTGSAPTSCTSTSNTADVTTVNNPTALVLTGSSICSSDPGTGTISSGTSVSGVSYQLYDVSNTPVQSAKSGTGSGLTWTALAAGTGYYVIGTGGAPTSCTSTSNTANVTTVNNPTALVLTGSSICSSDTGTGTISSGTSASGVSYQLYDVSNTPVQTAKSGTGSGLTWTALTAGTGYYVIGTGSAPTSCTSTSNAVSVSSLTNPSTPVVSVKTPASCSSSLMVINVDSPIGASYEYNNNDGAWQQSTEFTIQAGDGFSIKARLSNGIICESAPATCENEQTAAKVTESDMNLGSIEYIVDKTTVKAYPNPFNNTVNFKIESMKDTEGSLELVNMFGQRVMTVYDGKINAGISNFEVNIPTQQTTTLIYVLRLGQERITGKLIQLKR